MKKLILAVPPIIIISITAALVMLLLKFWVTGIFVLVLSIIVNWWSETFALHPSSKSNVKYDFRVLTFNINRAHDISINKGTTEELIDFVIQQNADLVLLQEYNAELYPEIQEELTKGYPYSSGIESNSRFKSIFSRYPIEAIEQLMIDINNNHYELFQNAFYNKKRFEGMEVLPICKMIINVQGKSLQVFNCHLMSNNYSVVIRNLKKKGKNLLYGILPIIHRMDFGYNARILQVKEIEKHIEPSMPTLICGDFNDIGGSASLRLLKRHDLTDAWWKKGFGFGFTFHGMGLRFRLDHVLFSNKTMMPVKSEVIKTELSDHYPLICTFKFV